MRNPAWSGTKELWITQPWVKTCFEYGMTNFVFWQKLYSDAWGYSPRKQLTLFARGREWRSMFVDRHVRCAFEMDSTGGLTDYVAGYPIWNTEMSIRRLRKLCEDYPAPGVVVGEFHGHDRPIVAKEGQERRILINKMPNSGYHWSNVMGEISKVKRDHPEIIFHFAGTKSLARTLGVGVDSFDHPVRLEWVDGIPHLLMPNGQIAKTPDEYPKYRKWGYLMGKSLGSIAVIKERKELSQAVYEFNLSSLRWAFVNYNRVWAWGLPGQREAEVDIDSPDDTWVPPDLRYRPRLRDAMDKWLCDTCSLVDTCPYARAGAICIVSDSEVSELARRFRTRSSSDIVDALGSLLGAQAERIERGIKAEIDALEEPGSSIDKELTKLITDTFDRGVQLARLVDPAIAAQMGPHGRVAVGVINAQSRAAVSGGSPQALMAGVAKALEAQGKSIETASAEDVADVLGSMAPSGETIIEVTSED